MACAEVAAANAKPAARPRLQLGEVEERRIKAEGRAMLFHSGLTAGRV
jgi:hypothetical protein